MVFVKSTDGGRSFTKPEEITTFESFDAADFAGDPEAAEQAHEEAFENADGTYSEDTCPNAGGLDQNIYGASFGP